MALSKSFITAQDSVVCQLCETEPKLQFKCLDCDILMCVKCCEKTHAKFKNAKRHKIIDIKEVGQMKVSKLELDLMNIPCKTHTQQFCCLHCTRCISFVCPSCIAKEHAGHSLIEIKIFHEKMLKKLNDGISKLEIQEKELNKEEKRIISIKEQEQGKHADLLKEIETQRKTYRNDIDNHFDKLTADIKLRMDQTNTFVEKEINVISRARKDLTKKRRESDTLKHTRSATEFFTSTPALLNDIKRRVHVSTSSSPQTMLKYVPKYRNVPENILGSLEEPTEKREIKKNMQLRLMRKYTTSLEAGCHHIAACSDGSLFIAESMTRQAGILEKVLPQNETIKTIFRRRNEKILDISTLHNASNDILLAHTTPTLIVVNGSTGKGIKSNYNAGSLLIFSVHVTFDNKIVVGARSTEDAFPITGSRVVIVMDFDGKHQTEWEYNKQGKRLFSLPRPSASVSNGNIFVVDIIADDDSGRVIALDPIGDVLNTYIGHPNVNNKLRPFTPYGMTTTLSENVVVCDSKNHALHLLRNEGTPLSYIDTSVFGIKRPHCITISGTDKRFMYIGCTKPIISSTNAKLYEMEFSEIK